jgi:ABC-2 type transport system ATP-binding protein
MNALEIKNLTKEYKDFKLDNINLTLPMGSIMGLIGENGAGKSTTIKLILDLITRDSGEINVLDKDNREAFNKTKEDVGVVLDEACFTDCVNAKNINNMMKSMYGNWDEKTYFGYIEKLKLPKDKKFKDFSRGMKMKLALAVALSHNARLLILDEATSGLDPIVRDEILDIFYDFIQDENHSILISSHIISDLEKICDYITFLHKGRLVVSEEKDALKEKYCLVRCAKDDISKLPREAIKGMRRHEYGAEALVEASMLPKGFQAEQPSIEDIILLLVKGVN